MEIKDLISTLSGYEEDGIKNVEILIEISGQGGGVAFYESEIDISTNPSPLDESIFLYVTPVGFKCEENADLRAKLEASEKEKEAAEARAEKAEELLQKYSFEDDMACGYGAGVGGELKSEVEDYLEKLKAAGGE